MQRTEPFRTLDDVRQQRQRLKALRAGHIEGIKSHWGTLREPAFTGAVIQGGFRDLWHSWRPLETLRTVAGDGGDLGSMALGILMGRRATSPWGRALTWAAGIVVPMVTARLGENERAQHLISEVRLSWERIKAYVAQRRAARRKQDQMVD